MSCASYSDVLMLQKSAGVRLPICFPTRIQAQVLLFMAMQREDLLMSVVSQARPVFPSLSPRLSGKTVPLWLPHSPCEMNHHSLMDLGIHQQDLPLAESIHGDKAPSQKVSTYLFLGIMGSAATLPRSCLDLYFHLPPGTSALKQRVKGLC